MSSFAAQLLLLFIATSCVMIQVDSKSELGIGTRIIGDQLLMKDVLKTPPTGLTEDPSIQFNYAISQPITYIEIQSEKDIYASIDLSYENELVHGTIRETKYGLASKPRPFEVLIKIYGLNDTLLGVTPSYILNRDQQFNGVLKPKIERQPHETLSLMHDDSAVLSHLDEEYDEASALAMSFDMGENYEEEDDDDYDEYEAGTFNQKLDKIIELGSRQEDDYLLYETYQTSPNSSETATNHTVTFYYIDSDFITFVKFTIYDHFLANPLANYKSPTVQFEKLSPHTLKAIVTDQHTTSLFVQMQIYGFKPNDKPVAYESYMTQFQSQLTKAAASATHNSNDDMDYIIVTLPLTKHRRTKIHFNAVEENGDDDDDEQEEEEEAKWQQLQMQQHHTQHHHHDPVLPTTVTTEGTAYAGHGSLLMFNWLLCTFSTLTLGLIWRQIVV